MAKAKRKPKRQKSKLRRRPIPSTDPSQDLDAYITLQRAKLKRDAKIKRVIEIFTMELRSEFPKSRQPRVRITMTDNPAEKLEPPHFYLWVNARPKPKQHVLEMDPIIKRAADRSGLMHFFKIIGTGTDFKTRDNDFIEKKFVLQE